MYYIQKITRYSSERNTSLGDFLKTAGKVCGYPLCAGVPTEKFAENILPWLLQNGYPLLNARRNYNNSLVIITQVMSRLFFNKEVMQFKTKIISRSVLLAIKDISYLKIFLCGIFP